MFRLLFFSASRERLTECEEKATKAAKQADTMQQFIDRAEKAEEKTAAIA